MKKLLFLVATIIVSGFAVISVVATPVFAASCTCKSVDQNGNTITFNGETMDAAILKDVCDCGHGEAIKAILVLVADVMSVCIGILAAVGITICGVQYLTAGDSEEKTKKAKRRLFEIVIGLLVYVLLYSILKFLLPGFSGLNSI